MAGGTAGASASGGVDSAGAAAGGGAGASGAAGAGGAAGDAGLGEPPVFGPAILIAELSDPNAADQDPTLTADGLEICFASLRSGNSDLWSSRRSSLEAPWGAPVRVDSLSTEAGEASPHLSADGLTIWFASDRAGGAGGHDVWMATRSTRDMPWSAAERIAEVSSDASDLAPSVDGNWFALASLRNGETYDLYLATRSGSSSPWGAPEPIAAVNSEASEWDPLLALEGRQLLFSARHEASVDLFWSERATVAESFGTPRPVASLNTEYSDHDPWWSPELGLMVFASDRSGVTKLYEATRAP